MGAITVHSFELASVLPNWRLKIKSDIAVVSGKTISVLFINFFCKGNLVFSKTAKGFIQQAVDQKTELVLVIMCIINRKTYVVILALFWVLHRLFSRKEKKINTVNTA